MEDATVLISRLQNGERELRTVLIEENMGLVKHVAKRFLGRGTDMEDLVQIAVIGLMKAIDQFDLNYNVKFSTYAVPLIVGELKKYFRDSGMLKVSRTLKEECVRIKKAEEQYRNQFGKEASMDDLVKILNMNREEIVLALESSREVESIYSTVRQDDGSELLLVDRISSRDGENLKGLGYFGKAEEEKILNRIFVNEIMKSLSEKEQRLISLRFYQEKTQSEVAKVLNMSQVQVSRMEKKILLSIRKNYSNK